MDGKQPPKSDLGIQMGVSSKRLTAEAKRSTSNRDRLTHTKHTYHSQRSSCITFTLSFIREM